MRLICTKLHTLIDDWMHFCRDCEFGPTRHAVCHWRKKHLTRSSENDTIDVQDEGNRLC